VPWGAGGPADSGFRIMAESAATKFGQPVVIENKAGASGVLGAIALQNEKPDGYVISQMHMSVLRQPLLNKSLTYNPITDLTYILQVTGYIMGVVVRADAPWKTLPELLAHAKANPGKLNYGTLGVGSTQQLAMERVAMLQNLTWTHAPYRGTADTMRALLGGEIDFASESSAWAPMCRPASCGCWQCSPPSAPNASPTSRRSTSSASTWWSTAQAAWSARRAWIRLR
jgi:tripartite-type tricarboxylate transporter receptor subunit TctC